MINIYICDKDIPTQQSLSASIMKIAQNVHLDINITTFISGEDLLSSQPELADIIYMDVVQVGTLNGIATAKELRRNGCCAEIIFVTSSAAHVYAAYDINPLPVQYLIKKTITDEKFESVFLRAVTLAENKRQNVLILNVGDERKVIPYKEISYSTIKNSMVSIFYAGREMRVRSSLLYLQEQLPASTFIRTHRSYIINLKYVSCILHLSVILTTGQRIPIGLTYAKTVEQAFSRYLEEVC